MAFTLATSERHEKSGLRVPFKTIAGMADLGNGQTAWQRRTVALVAPLLPLESPKPQGGRPRVPDRVCRTGIVFVLKTGIQWELLPQEMGCGSGMTCWRRLRD
jgi:hypothetical protein